MEVAGFTLTVVGTAELCLKYGGQLRERYHSFKHAGQEIEEAILKLETDWLRIEAKILFLQRIWVTLDVALQKNQERVLQVLLDKLQTAWINIDRLRRGPQLKDPVGGTQGMVDKYNRAKYAAYVKAPLVKIIAELENWEPRFDPSFFLIARLGTPTVDQSLAGQSIDSKEISIIKRLRTAQRLSATPTNSPTSVFLSPADLTGKRTPIPQSAQAIIVADSGQRVLVDTVVLKSPSTQDQEIRDVRNLARVLREADTGLFCLLKCRGVVKGFDRRGVLTHFDFVFGVPSDFQQVKNLRSVILDKDVSPTLDNRYELANSMAKSVAYVHTFNFVHKNISPDTILVFQNSRSMLNPSFLVGFEKFRHADTQSDRVGDQFWEKNIYRHPGRQGEHPENMYKMQHDIYSLGVCLLEIGMWRSFVIPTLKGAEAGAFLDIQSLLLMKDNRRKALEIKAKMLSLARERLPSLMGRRYTEVVINCMTCLDEPNGFGNEADFEDEDGIKVGVRYIEKILGELERISL